jgi:hypothetical protein
MASLSTSSPPEKSSRSKSAAEMIYGQHRQEIENYKSKEDLETSANQSRRSHGPPHTNHQDHYHQGSDCQTGLQFLRIHYLQK